MSSNPRAQALLSERLRRQFLAEPVGGRRDYLDAFRRLQPVSPVYFTMPGDPPRLTNRTAFDDGPVTDRLRGKRTIIKGRFLGGTIGYVLAEDLAMYANTFRKPLSKPNEAHVRVMQAVSDAGPLTPRQLKDETGLLNKVIMPALHRLQSAFLVYEDQTDCDWERAWYEFASEWPEVDVGDESFESSARQVLGRFFEAHAFATAEQVKDWTRLSARQLKAVLGGMAGDGLIIPERVPGMGEGWTHRDTKNLGDGKPASSAFMLHKADYLVRSHASELKRRFGEHEVLQYLLIDGQFQGAVLGHWRIGPHNVSDIVLTLPAASCAKRRAEIIEVVGRRYAPPDSGIERYCGTAL